MAAKKIAGVWVISLDEDDQSLGELSYAAGEVLKIDVSGTDLSGLAMTLAPTQSGDPVAEFEPETNNGTNAEFRVSDDDLSPWIEEGEFNYLNLWTGTESDPRRRSYGTVKRKVSIRRTVVPPPPPTATTFDGTSLTFDSTSTTFDEAA